MIANHHHNNPYIQGNENYAQILGQLAHGAESHQSANHLQQQPIHPSLLPQHAGNGLNAGAASLQHSGGHGHLNAGIINQHLGNGLADGNRNVATPGSSAPFAQPLSSPAPAPDMRSPALDSMQQPLGMPGNDALAPPTEGVFQARQDLLDYVRQHALAHGYIATIHHSSRDRQVTLGCDLGGSYRPHSSHSAIPTTSRRRKTSSKLQGCPFKVYGHREKTGEWTLRIQDATHNHPPPTDLNRHPMARRLSDESTSYALDLLSQGVKPRDVLAAIKQRDPNTRALQKDIYNMKQKLKQAHGRVSAVDTSSFTGMDSFNDTTFDPSLSTTNNPDGSTLPPTNMTTTTGSHIPSSSTTNNNSANLQPPDLPPEDLAANRDREKDAKIKQLESTVSILRGEAAMVTPLKQRVRQLLEELQATEDDKQALMELRSSPAMQRLLARGGGGGAGAGAGGSGGGGLGGASGLPSAFAGFPVNGGLGAGVGRWGVGGRGCRRRRGRRRRRRWGRMDGRIRDAARFGVVA